jgi:prophage tail gpP-like protein
MFTEQSSFSLTIGGKAFAEWTEIELEDSIDGFSAVCFTAPFDPANKAFRDFFRPFSFARVEVKLDDELQFTGSLVSVEPSANPESSTVKVQAYALPAVLCDCPVPATYDKQETSGLHLLAIASQMCSAFGFSARFADARSAAGGRVGPEFGGANLTNGQVSTALRDLEKTFDKVRIRSDQTVHSFLCGLAQQRGLVMSNDVAGNLIFQKSVSTGNAVVQLQEGQPPLISVSPQFNGQGYCSEVTATVAKKRAKGTARATEQNPFLRNVRRPMHVRCTDSKPADATFLARTHLARMLANSAGWEVELPTIVNDRGELFRPNTTLTLKAPSAMIYGKHELLIRSVTKRSDKDSTTAKLGLVLPGAFSGEMPTVLPWQEAL